MTDPDGNARSWDTLADAYQHEVGWPEDDLAWGIRCPRESQLAVLAGASGATLVLGCGGGQDLVALARLGLGPLTGLDASPRQLAHARMRLAAHDLEADLVESDAADLSRFAADSFAMVVSVQALDYVGDAAACFGHIARVLRPGGTLAFSVVHPADAATAETTPFGWEHSYFDVEREWVWDGLADADPVLRSWYRSPADWFTLVTGAGLVVDRLLEPPPSPDPWWHESGWVDADGWAKLDRVPGTIVVRARRPDLDDFGSPPERP